MVNTHGPILRQLAIIAAALLAAALPAVATAAVSASVDRNPVLQGEAFTLEITDDERKGEDPDLSALDTDFRIVNRATSSQISIVNGVTRQTRSWRITLIPLKTGRITIPSIAVGQQRTQPIQLQVNPASSQTGQSRDAFIEFNVEPRDPHLRELVRVDVSLFVRGQLASGNLTQPQADGAVIEARGEQRDESVLRNGVRYRKITREYALFPERSGELTIAAPLFSGEIEDPRNRRSLFGFAPATRSVYAAAEPITLTVAPAIGDGPWLPAEGVTLRDELTPAAGPYTAGEPVTRVVELTVDGQIHTQVPEIELPVPAAARTYTEPTEQQTLDAGGTPRTVRRLRTVIIPDAAGELTLPPLEIRWWNTATRAFEIARLPARTLTVAAGAASTATPPAAPPPQPASSAAPQAPAPSATGQPHPWPAIALAAIIGWTLTLIVLLRRRPSAVQPSAPAAPPPRPSASRAIAALKSGDLPAARAAILAWARQMWGRDMTLDAIAQRCDDEPARQALRALDQALFGAHDPTIDRRALARWLASCRPPRERADKPPALPPLYPQSL